MADDEKSGYYQNNIQQAGHSPHKAAAEKKMLLDNEPQYTPVRDLPPVIIRGDSPQSPQHAQNELGSPDEKQNLVSPVKLSPSWEDNADKPADELNFRNITGEEKEPKDKFSLVYFILMLHGIGTLMPWNMFITATAYFIDYKLAGDEGTMYRKYFLSFLGFTAQIPNVLLNGINAFCQCKGGKISTRIIWSIIVIIVMFIATVVLAMIDSSAWPAQFFWITMVTVVIINMANGIYQNSVYGTAAFLPMKYTNAVVLGSNISGTLTSIIAIATLASTPDPRTAGIYYFLAAIVVLLLAFDTYFALPLIPFYKYHQNKAKARTTQQEVEFARPPYIEIFKKCWIQDISVFFVFFVTLTCFPAIQANVIRNADNFFIPKKYFTPVTCFLFFNSFAMLGNLTTEFVRKPGPRFVWIPVLLRVLFIPFFMLCSFYPDGQPRALPVLITNDYVYCVAGIIMAWSSGYLSSLTMMYAPSKVEPQHQGTAGMMAAFFLICGIFLGVTFSLPVTLFVEHVGPGLYFPPGWEHANCTLPSNCTLPGL